MICRGGKPWPKGADASPNEPWQVIEHALFDSSKLFLFLSLPLSFSLSFLSSILFIISLSLSLSENIALVLMCLSRQLHIGIVTIPALSTDQKVQPLAAISAEHFVSHWPTFHGKQGRDAITQLLAIRI